MSHLTTGTILDQILERTSADVATRKATRSLAELERLAGQRPDPVSLYECLAVPGMSVIAEIKRASPSRGRFKVQVDPAQVAADYIRGGAAAISVLTDAPFFQGSLEDMAAAAEVACRAERPVAILRKDFILDPYQIIEARAFGADAILLIVAALAQNQLARLFTVAGDVGLDALVEVHDEEELARAKALGARIVGINNRDLKTFSVDLAVTERLAPLAPSEAVIVAESGVSGPDEVRRLAEAGADAILVGEGVITAPNRAEAVKLLKASVSA